MLSTSSSFSHVLCTVQLESPIPFCLVFKVRMLHRVVNCDLPLMSDCTAGHQDACMEFNSTHDDRECTMLHASCVDDLLTSDLVVSSFPCRTAPVQAGSPVWLYYPSTDEVIITGVMTSSDIVRSQFTSLTQALYIELQSQITHMVQSQDSVWAVESEIVNTLTVQ